LEQYAERLLKYGLAPTWRATKATFNGLGGVQKNALESWRLPVDAYGKNLMVEYHAVLGDMIGLWDRKDMETLKTNLYLRKDSAKADLEALDLDDVELAKLPNKHVAIDFLQFDLEKLGVDNFAEFRNCPRDARGRQGSDCNAPVEG
jgi:hypothetical protein